MEETGFTVTHPWRWLGGLWCGAPILSFLLAVLPAMSLMEDGIEAYATLFFFIIAFGVFYLPAGFVNAFAVLYGVSLHQSQYFTVSWPYWIILIVFHMYFLRSRSAFIFILIAGIILLVFRSSNKELRALTVQTTQMVKKGLAEDIAGLVGNASALLNAMNELSRTERGPGIILIVTGLLLTVAGSAMLVMF